MPICRKIFDRISTTMRKNLMKILKKKKVKPMVNLKTTLYIFS